MPWVSPSRKSQIVNSVMQCMGKQLDAGVLLPGGWTWMVSSFTRVIYADYQA